MRISSKLLLIMVIGQLQFPDTSKAKENKLYFKEVTKEQKSVNNDFLYKFVQHYATNFEGKNLKIFFPTLKNIDEWRDLFRMSGNGSFMCKRGKYRELLKEIYHFNRYYSLDNVKIALSKAES